jgi:hypothetical protein
MSERNESSKDQAGLWHHHEVGEERNRLNGEVGRGGLCRQFRHREDLDFFGWGELDGDEGRLSRRERALLSVSDADVAELDMRRES